MQKPHFHYSLHRPSDRARSGSGRLHRPAPLRSTGHSFQLLVESQLLAEPPPIGTAASHCTRPKVASLWQCPRSGRGCVHLRPLEPPSSPRQRYSLVAVQAAEVAGVVAATVCLHSAGAPSSAGSVDRTRPSEAGSTPPRRGNRYVTRQRPLRQVPWEERRTAAAPVRGPRGHASKVPLRDAHPTAHRSWKAAASEVLAADPGFPLVAACSCRRLEPRLESPAGRPACARASPCAIPRGARRHLSLRYLARTFWACLLDPMWYRRRPRGRSGESTFQAIQGCMQQRR